jgi:hypothetical protein
MSSDLERSRPSLPIRRHFEVSRLEVQQIIAAYECIVPVIRRRLEIRGGSPPAQSPRVALTGPEREVGGSHQ